MSCSCDEIRLSLGAYLLGALPRAERALVENHLRTCADCRGDLASLDALPGVLACVDESDVARAEPSPDLLDRVLSAIASQRRPLPPVA